MTNSYLWNIVLADLIERAERAGIELPLWRSANVTGTETSNAQLIAHYSERIPELCTG